MGTPSRPIAQLAVGALVAGAAALAVTGCGGSSSVSNAVDPVAQAATTSAHAPGFQLNLAMRMTSGALPQPIDMSGHGVFTPSARLGQLSFTMQLPGAATQALGSSSLTFQEILDGSTIYMKLPAAISAKLPGGKPWLKLDLAHLGSATGLSGLGTLANNPTTTNPAQMLEYLRAESGDVRKVGSATIRGIPTTEYQATIQLDKYPNLLPSDKRAAARQAIQQVETMTGLHSIPVHVWIDDQHLVRQFQLTFTSQAAGQAVHAQMTMQMSHYGPQPAPTPPPADQIGDFTSLLGQGATSSATSPGTPTAP